MPLWCLCLPIVLLDLCQLSCLSFANKLYHWQRLTHKEVEVARIKLGGLLCTQPKLIPSKLWTIPYDPVYVEMKDIWPSERGAPHDCFLPCMIIVSFHACGLRWSICFLQSWRGSQGWQFLFLSRGAWLLFPSMHVASGDRFVSFKAGGDRRRGQTDEPKQMSHKKNVRALFFLVVGDFTWWSSFDGIWRKWSSFNAIEPIKSCASRLHR